jgi:hypothetical protein
MSPSTPENAKIPLTDERGRLLALIGYGKEIWADEHADEYVQRLREGWEMCDQLGPSRSGESGAE